MLAWQSKAGTSVQGIYCILYSECTILKNRKAVTEDRIQKLEDVSDRKIVSMKEDLFFINLKGSMSCYELHFVILVMPFHGKKLLSVPSRTFSTKLATFTGW